MNLGDSCIFLFASTWNLVCENDMIKRYVGELIRENGICLVPKQPKSLYEL